MNQSIITTKRLELRPIEFRDLDTIHALHSLPETDEYNTLGIPDNIEVTQSIIEPWIADNNRIEVRNYTLAIELKSEREFIGLFGLKLDHQKYNRAEVWYKVHPDYWNKGYATEALNAVLQFGFDILGVHRIEAGLSLIHISEPTRP